MIKDICEIYDVNEEQAKALDITANTALRAGAGSGKTRVLTKRFVRLLLDNPTLSLDSIVAITFTKKAATEMKDRIRRELSEIIAKSSDKEEKKRLSNLKMLISNANIDTIHGFCSKLLRDNFSFLGLDPAFAVMEEVDKSIRLSKLAEAVVIAYLEQSENAEVVKAIAETYSPGIFMGKLKQGIISAYQTIRETGDTPSDIIKAVQIDNNGVIDAVRAIEKAGGSLINDLDSRYRNFKEKENLLDFNDLEVLTEELLENDNIGSGYFDRFTYIMVDEFQDVNPLQKKILDHLTHKDGKLPSGRIFIVGDHKQSIYGFRGSDYRVFEEACEKISASGKVEQLNNCYRSTKNIINAVNGIFSQLLSPYERLEYPGEQEDTGRKVELVTWEKSVLKENKSRTKWDSTKALLTDEVSKEALKSALSADYDIGVASSRKDYQGDVVAGAVRKLVNEGFLYRDVAILLRSRSSLLEIESSFVKNGIPFCVLGGIGFWDRQEVNDILSLYRLVFYPEDRLSLAACLRSPVFGFSDDLILELSLYMKKAEVKQLDKLLSEFTGYTSTKDAWLIKRAGEILAELLPMDGTQNAFELLKSIIVVTAYDEVLMALPQGEKKLRNLEKLLRIVEEFEAKGIYSARELIQYLEVLKESSGMDGEAFLDNEDSDAVKILTIHASKGLEFRAVLIPDMDRLLDSQTKRNKPLYFVDEMVGLTAIGLDESLAMDEAANTEYAKYFTQKLLKELEDSRRLFYVAATRAKEYLAFIGEKQEAGGDEELDAQNTFMKQLAWATNKAGMIDEIASMDAVSYIAGEQKQTACPTTYIDEIKELSDSDPIHGTAAPAMLMPCEEEYSGSINISSWMKYRDCPKHYFLENLAGLLDKEQLAGFEEREEDDRLLSAAEFGTLLHAFLEEVDISGINFAKSDSINDVAAALEMDLAQIDRELFQKSVEGFLKIENEQRKVNRGKLVASLKEFSFRVPIAAGLNLTGFVDRIDIYELEGQLSGIIVDYKTNKVEDESETMDKLKYYEGQLLSYAWALNQLSFYKGRRVSVNEAMLYFLYRGEAVGIKPDSEHTAGIVNELLNSAAWLLGSKTLNEYRCIKSEKCTWCKSKKYCEVLS